GIRGSVRHTYEIGKVVRSAVGAGVDISIRTVVSHPRTPSTTRHLTDDAVSRPVDHCQVETGEARTLIGHVGIAIRRVVSGPVRTTRSHRDSCDNRCHVNDGYSANVKIRNKDLIARRVVRLRIRDTALRAANRDGPYDSIARRINPIHRSPVTGSARID